MAKFAQVLVLFIICPVIRPAVDRGELDHSHLVRTQDEFDTFGNYYIERQPEFDSMSTLHHAVVKRKLNEVKRLLGPEYNGDIDKKTLNGETALSLAIKRGLSDIVEVLLVKGASPNMDDGEQVTPLLMAIQRENIVIAEKLLEHKADPNLVLDKNLTPLGLAINRKNVRMVEILLKHNADPNLATWGPSFPATSGQSPLNEAVSEAILGGNQHHLDTMDIIRILLNKGANINAVDDWGNSALGLVEKNKSVKQNGVLKDIENLLRGKGATVAKASKNTI
ncbi:ankyrin repeats (3 copies) domain-containing protein [Ditylenchus destructor]|nr:ankyrin repeats (3 copies) domain-containing protein [Ditylenchus destructor]